MAQTELTEDETHGLKILKFIDGIVLIFCSFVFNINFLLQCVCVVWKCMKEKNSFTIFNF